MLHKYFGLSKIPFSPTRLLFESDTMTTGLLKLQTILFSPQIALITGKIGRQDSFEQSFR